MGTQNSSFYKTEESTFFFFSNPLPFSLVPHQDLWFPQTLHRREEHEPAAEAEGAGEGVERTGHPSPLRPTEGLLLL